MWQAISAFFAQIWASMTRADRTQRDQATKDADAIRANLERARAGK